MQVTIPDEWIDDFKKLTPADRVEIRTFIHSYKEDFDPSKMREQVKQGSKATGKHLKRLGRSKTVKKFICDYLLPTRHNMTMPMRYYGGDTVMYEFLKALEKSLDQVR